MIILENTFLKSQIYDKLVTMWLSYHFFVTEGLFNFCWCKPFWIIKIHFSRKFQLPYWKIDHFVTKNCFCQFFQCPQHCLNEHVPNWSTQNTKEVYFLLKLITSHCKKNPVKFLPRYMEIVRPGGPSACSLDIHKEIFCASLLKTFLIILTNKSA